MTLAVSRGWMQRFNAKRGQAATKNGGRAKYGNKKVKGFDADGATVTFDSKREAKRWGELVAMRKAGEIDSLERQVPFLFEIGGECLTYVGSNRKVKYILDFRYREVATGEWAHEDVKSDATKTPAYKIKAALMLRVHSIEVLEVS